MSSWLLDTGPLVAYLDARDSAHAEVVACLDRFTGDLFTTSAVITEAMHFVTSSREGPRLLAEFVAASRLTVFDFTQPATLSEAAGLMEKYSDLPMDFADATLVHLARRESLTTIFTIDHDDFETYRIAGRRRFRITPSRPRRHR